MARRRYTPEQIIRKLREADRLLGEGAEIAEVARYLEVCEQTYDQWRNQFGGPWSPYASGVTAEATRCPDSPRAAGG